MLRDVSLTTSGPFYIASRGDNSPLGPVTVTRKRFYELTKMTGGWLSIAGVGEALTESFDVWGLREDTDTRAIDNFVVRLRKYVEEIPSKPRHLLTVRGLGYRFIAKPGTDAP